MNSEKIIKISNSKKSRKIKWGIISTAKIARKHVIPALEKSKEAEIVAIASRDLKKLENCLREDNLIFHRDSLRIYGSYEALLRDPDVDAIYNPLPNHLHVPISVAALKAGKHVLCEKPIALNTKEVEKLQKVLKEEKKMLFMEAFMVRFHLQWQTALKVVTSKTNPNLGKIKALQVFFSYHNTDRKNIRNIATYGGGGMYDIGCYAMIAGKYFFQAIPQRVVSVMEIDPRFGTDSLCSAIYDFGKERHLTFTVSTQLSSLQHVFIVGTKGSLQIPIPFNPPADQPLAIKYNDEKTVDDSKIKPIKIPACDHYQLQCEAFGRAIRGEERLSYSIDDAISNMRIIDATFKSAKTAKWVKV